MGYGDGSFVPKQKDVIWLQFLSNSRQITSLLVLIVVGQKNRPRIPSPDEVSIHKCEEYYRQISAVLPRTYSSLFQRTLPEAPDQAHLG